MSSVDPQSQPILELRDIAHRYETAGRGLLRKSTVVHAVNGVSFSVQAGETFGLVGESGCGKSTLARLALGIEEPTEGDVLFDGHSITNLPAHAWRALRQKAQMIFQDPSGSLDPRMPIGDQIREPLDVHHSGSNAENEKIVETTVDAVGLPKELMQRYPHELSGGQQQRVVIARALVLNPALIVCDEPISALDVSVQAQVVNLLRELQQRLSLTYLFISHDLAIVRHICDRIAIMYLGEIVELADRDTLFEDPRHPYTQALISAIPVSDPRARKDRTVLRGDPPNAINLPSGCRFHTRCPHAEPHCVANHPALAQTGPSQYAACHFTDATRTAARELAP